MMSTNSNTVLVNHRETKVPSMNTMNASAASSLPFRTRRTAMMSAPTAITGTAYVRNAYSASQCQGIGWKSCTNGSRNSPLNRSVRMNMSQKWITPPDWATYRARANGTAVTKARNASVAEAHLPDPDPNRPSAASVTAYASAGRPMSGWHRNANAARIIRRSAAPRVWIPARATTSANAHTARLYGTVNVSDENGIASAAKAATGVPAARRNANGNKTATNAGTRNTSTSFTGMKVSLAIATTVAYCPAYRRRSGSMTPSFAMAVSAARCRNGSKPNPTAYTTADTP